MPEDGKLVIAILSDGSEINAYRLDGFWWTGVENDPSDAKVSGVVVSWREFE